MRSSKLVHWMLSVGVAYLFAAMPVFGQVETDSYAEDFEGFDLDDLIVVESAAWGGASTNAGVIVSTNYTANYVGGDFPLDYDHTVLTQALWFEDTLTNMVQTQTESMTNWVDMVLKPTFSDSDEVPDFPPLSSIAGVYFSTNGALIVSHTPSNEVDYVEWVETDVVVGEDDWIRLTIAANLKDGGSPFGGGSPGITRFYQIYINGVVVTNAAAFQTPDRGSSGGGSWFGTRASTKTTLSGTVFQGTGYVDDMVVQQESVFVDKTTVTIGGTFTVQNKVYDGTVSATIDDDSLTLVGVESGDTVELGSVTLEFVQAGVGTDVEVTIVGATLTGADAGSYTVSLAGAPTSEADITQKALTVTGLTGDDKTYDGTTDASASGTASLSGIVSPDVVTLDGSPVFTFAQAGVGTGISISTTGYTLGGADEANYTLTQPTLSANITQKALTVTPDPEQGKEEGDAEPMLTFGFSGAVGDEEPSFTGELSRDTGEAAGTYEILQGTLELADGEFGFLADNYELQFTTGVLFTITAADGPSQTWLDGVSLTTGDLDEDLRGDGMTVREAWLASVNPTNATETFRVIGMGQADGSNYVQWVSTYVDETLPPFAIWARTNLMDETYMPVGELPREVDEPFGSGVTNTWWGEAAAHPIFYRVVATNWPSID